jgi:membrane-associated protease RseP (regulator of RpoE activity)
LPIEEETPKPQEEQRRIEFSFPLLILRTKRFTPIFDKLGSFRASRYIGWVFLILVPFVAGGALYLIVNSLIGVLVHPEVGQVIRQLGPGTVLLIPGINPLLPIFYGWLGIVCAIVVHEGAHGIIARNAGLNVKSSGLVFFLIVPIGAFVDVDEEQLKKAKPRPSLKVMAAGFGGNIILGAVCLISLLIIVGGLTPVIDNGVYINDVTQGLPAQSAGILPKDVLVSVDNMTINNSTILRAVLDNKTAGDIIQVTLARGEHWQDHFSTVVNLTISDNRTVMGISASDLMTKERLANYESFSIDKYALYIVPPTLASSVIPFSDSLAQFYTSWLGPNWQILANVLFWLWFVNFNLAIFNALPIYPLDGGRIFNISLRAFGKRLSEKAIYAITLAVTSVCVTLVVLGIVLPFII